MISGKKDLNINFGGYNLNNALKHDRNRSGIVSFEGQVYKDGLDVYSKYYNNQLKPNSYTLNVLSERDMIESHMYSNDIYGNILQNRIEKYNNNADYYKLRECLEVYDENFLGGLRYNDLWNQIYKGLKRIKDKIICINNKLIYIDTCFINGYTRLFKMYSRLGYDVRINTNNNRFNSLSINGMPIGFSFKNFIIGRIFNAFKRRFSRFVYIVANLLYTSGLISVTNRIKFINSQSIDNPVQIYDELDKIVISKTSIGKIINLR